MSKIRVARPPRDRAAASFYGAALGLPTLATFDDHDGSTPDPCVVE